MPLVGRLAPLEESGGGTIVDPLNFVEVVIPVTFPGDISLSLNCVTIVSSSSSQSSPGSSLSFSSSVSSTPANCYSQNEDPRPPFLPIDEVPEEFGEEDIGKILRESHSETTSFRDDYTECDLDLDDVDFDEFENGSGQVTSTTCSGGSEALTPRPPSPGSEEEEEEEEILLENPNPAPCVHCQGGKDHSSIADLIWPIQLDIDLIKTLVQLCPDFFDDFDEVEMDPMDLGNSPISSEDPSSTSQDIQPSSSQSEVLTGSPSNVVDDSPLQPSMDRNKESLKVKLLLRRPMNQLVEQGILPPPKTPAFAEQRARLERARMGDLLKAKIQQRPARQELIRQHILEDSDARVAPSLAEKQRMLKRARLADSLNDHLIHRPGPLELVKKNILHAPDAIIDQAIKEGVVPFKATSEGSIPGPHVPSNIYLSEDDSSSDLSSPAGTPDQSQSSSSAETQKGVADLTPVPQSPTSTTLTPQSQLSPFPSVASPVVSTQQIPTSTVSVVSVASPCIPPPPPLPQQAPSSHIQNDLLSKIVKAAVTSSTTPPITSAQLTLSKLSNIEHQQLLSAVQQNQPPPRTLTNNTSQGTSNAFSQHHSSGKTRTTKKSTPKIKSQPKARQIKFHEYKGPPSAQKGQQHSPQQEVESSSYELLLQQQQLFLQWQLECRQKYPQIILPAVSKLASPTEVAATFASAVSAANAASVSMVPGTVASATATTPIVRSPATISSAMNSNNTGASGLQPIAPAPAPITVQALVEKYNKNAATISASLPLKVSVPHSNVSQIENRPKLTPARTMDASGSATSPKAQPTLDATKLNDWKVSDLKAELKKRNLPVSGAKPQLIERLKQADASLQDESISSSSNGTKAMMKTEAQQAEESSSNEMMEVVEVSAFSTSQNKDSFNQEQIGKNSNVAALNAAMLTLLQNNNLQSNSVIPIHILNALANVAKSSNQKTGTNGKTQNIVVVDEKVLREQQIEQLQQALKSSPTQHQHVKVSSQPVSGQKHRIALQQHLQQKMQQQALQSQLQKLIQLHTLQQQQQQLAQKTAVQAQKLTPGKILNAPQQPQIKLLEQRKPQKATNQEIKENSTLTLHQSNEVEKKLQNGLIHVPMKINEACSPAQVNVPFRIVQFGTSAANSTQIQDEEATDFSNIPQLQIPEIKNAAFQSCESDSSQSTSTTKSGSFSSESGDPMDHSWLLKINEGPPGEPKKSVVKEFASFFENFANGERKEEPKLQTPKPRRGFKSQMVDDVLEILIRNGELPPSAAQDPSTPTTPGKSVRVLSYPAPTPPPSSSEESKNSATLTTPPPPPPLPPPSFAVTLPTSITFSRSPTANPLLSPFHPLGTETSNMNKGPPPPYPAEALSKEARDILKISQDLSNFGKAHAQIESDRLSSSSDIQHRSPTVMRNEEFDSNSLAMLLDEAVNDGMPVLGRMDVEMEHHSIPSTLNDRFQVTGTTDEEMPDQHRVSSVVKHEDLLDELGTLLPPELDVSMPMEMDYSDWLDQLLPENTQSTAEPFENSLGLPVVNQNNNFSLNNNFFMEYHNSDSSGNRDPLLSSSFNIFSIESNGQKDAEMKPTRSASPMAVGENLMWDFF